MPTINDFIENASPDNWLKYSYELNESANILWKESNNITFDWDSHTKKKVERPTISRNFMLIAGLSIETILKAYLISIHPSYVNEGRLDKKLKEHDLIKILKLTTKLRFNKREMELMRILSEAIPNWGRYPIPLNFNEIKKETILTKNIYNTYEKLYNKLYNIVRKKLLKGWDSGKGIGFKKLVIINNSMKHI